MADVPREATNDAIVHNLTHSPKHEDWRRKLHTELKSWMWASFHDVTDAWISFGSEDLLYRFLAHRVLSHFTWNFPAVEFQVPAAEFLRAFRSALAAEADQDIDLAGAENVRYPDRLVATEGRVSIVYHINSGKWRLDVDPDAPTSEEQSNT